MTQAIAEFPERFKDLFRPSRYKVIYSGRGAAKSWSVAQALLIKSLNKKIRILCAREYMNSIAESVHYLLSERIVGLGLSQYFEIKNTSILSKNGSEYVFAGLKTNVEKLKSMEGIDILWVEEAQNVSENSWEIAIPTIREKGSEIWVTFNPNEETDPTYKRFVKNTPPDTILIKTSWQYNPWLTEELRNEKDYLYSIDIEAAEHVWGGNCRNNSIAEVLRGRYIVESFEPDEQNWCGPYFGADWGYAVSPTVLVKLWVNERVLYIENEAFGVGVDIDDTPALFDKIKDAKKFTIRADNSRPETIKYMRRHGYSHIRPCLKGRGSIEDGIEHLRSYERIVIHPRCKHAYEQAQLWSYKQDAKTKEVLPIVKDGNDDIWDAARYALEPIIRLGRPSKRKIEERRKPRDYDELPEITNNWKIV
jgi:phage terminase large subunit